tara:strand:- start:177 stop:569 length:393 start_codon:yes stop_codon:yes gene_type:complete
VPIKKNHLFLDVAKNLIVSTKMRVGFFIVGDYLEKDIIIVDDLELNSIVTVSGFLKDMDVVYSGLDLIALILKYEGTSVTLIESMVPGIPFVTTNLGGVPNIVPEGVGKLVPSGDVASFAKELLIAPIIQ